MLLILIKFLRKLYLMYSPFSVVHLAIFRAVGRSKKLGGNQIYLDIFIGAGFPFISEKMKGVGGKIAPPAHPAYAGPAILR